MIEDLLVINGTGQALYGWHNETDKDTSKDDLISGFLTALNSFATAERGEDIKSLKMKESIILFEKHDELEQKLVFVVTTKDEKLLELLHAIIHDVMKSFIAQFETNLDKVFDGDVTAYHQFDGTLERIFQSYGLDELAGSLEEIDQQKLLNAILFLEPKGGNIYYIHAKEYINKEKMSFLIPLIVNSSKLLYGRYLNQEIDWISLNIIDNRTILLELRKNIIILKIYKHKLEINSQEILNLPYFKSNEKYVKRPQKIIEIFKDFSLQENIQQFFLVDMVGKVFYEDQKNSSHNFEELIPETISFVTASKKASQEIYNKTMLMSAINGVKTTTIYINFNTFALVIIANAEDFSNYKDIQYLCFELFQQILSHF